MCIFSSDLVHQNYVTISTLIGYCKLFCSYWLLCLISGLQIGLVDTRLPCPHPTPHQTQKQVKSSCSGHMGNTQTTELPRSVHNPLMSLPSVHKSPALYSQIKECCSSHSHIHTHHRQHSCYYILCICSKGLCIPHMPGFGANVERTAVLIPFRAHVAMAHHTGRSR